MNPLRSSLRKEGSKPATNKGQEKRIKELEQAIKVKDHRIDELRHELKRYAQELGKREQDIKLLLKNDRRWTEFKDFVEKAMENKTAIEKDDLKRDIKSLTAANEVLLKTLDDTRTERDGIRAEWKKTGEALRNVQASAFRFQDQPEWAPDSDESIRRELKSLEGNARAWCNENSIKALSMLRMTPDELLNEWGSVMRYDEKVFAKNDQHLPQLILLALLMDCIYGDIFAKPFWFLPWRILGAEAEEGANKVVCRGLYEGLAGVLEETTQGNLEGSHSWRSQWLRLLDPKPRDQQERHLLEATKTRTELARKKAADSLMENFLATSAAFLITTNPLNEPQLAQLQLIFSTAAQISHKLWLRKSYLEIRTIRGLPNTYAHTQERLDYHSLHNEFLSAEETGLDGYPIIVVTHPAVLVHGNSDGSNYGAPPRIWKEARVWMG